jgi:hypothetical protein
MKIAATGYVARQPSDDAFDLIFSRPETPTVSQSSVRIDNRVYHGPILHKMMPREKIEVLVPLRSNRGHAWVNQRGSTPQRIEMAPTFTYGDRAGARYQASLEAASNRVVRDLARDLDPTVSTFELQKRAADMTPPKANPPERWDHAAVIDKTGMLGAPEDTEAAEEARIREELKEYLAGNSKAGRGTGGGNRIGPSSAT